MILPSIAVLGAWVLAWGGLGFSLDPLWWLSLLAVAVWAAALSLRLRKVCGLGLALTVGLACGVGVAGSLTAALGVAALALWAWDLGLLWISRLQYGDPAVTRRLARTALVRSTGLCTATFAVSLGFASVQFTIPFWWLVGGALAVWGGLVFIVRGLSRAQDTGDEASGNRSSSRGETL